MSPAVVLFSTCIHPCTGKTQKGKLCACSDTADTLYMHVHGQKQSSTSNHLMIILYHEIFIYCSELEAYQLYFLHRRKCKNTLVLYSLHALYAVMHTCSLARVPTSPYAQITSPVTSLQHGGMCSHEIIEIFKDMVSNIYFSHVHEVKHAWYVCI